MARTSVRGAGTHAGVLGFLPPAKGRTSRSPYSHASALRSATWRGLQSAAPALMPAFLVSAASDVPCRAVPAACRIATPAVVVLRRAPICASALRPARSAGTHVSIPAPRPWQSRWLGCRETPSRRPRIAVCGLASGPLSWLFSQSCGMIMSAKNLISSRGCLAGKQPDR